jgi:hypothetical protein
MMDLLKISEALHNTYEQVKEQWSEKQIEQLKQAQDEWKQAFAHALSNIIK